MYFFAEEFNDTTPPVIEGTIDNLQTSGNFLSNGNDSDNEFLVDILAQGVTVEVDSNGGLHSIAKIELEFAGGDLDGQTPDEIIGGQNLAGWKTGIHSSAESQADPNANYNAAWDVTLTGTKLSNFQEYGVLGGVLLDARGSLLIKGQTKIESNGVGLLSVPQIPSTQGVGIRLVSHEGYVSLQAEGTSESPNLIRKNGLDGVQLLAQATTQNAFELRDAVHGFFVNMEGTRINGNLRHGIQLEADRGIVGSTWWFEEETVKHITTEPHPQNPLPVDSGWGIMDGCSVFKNKGRGVEVIVDNGGTDLQSQSIAALRFVNCFFWGNEDEGFFATGNNDDGILLTPFVHCTLADHDASPTVDVATLDNFQFIPGNSSSDELYTMVFGSILQRANPGIGFDFGPGITGRGLLAFDDGNISSYASGSIYCAGLRCRPDYSSGLDTVYTPLASPFVGSFQDDPAQQYYLDTGHADFGDFDETQPYLGGVQPQAAGPAAFDYENDARPPLDPGAGNSDRDKGARQNP